MGFRLCRTAPAALRCSRGACAIQGSLREGKEAMQLSERLPSVGRAGARARSIVKEFQEELHTARRREPWRTSRAEVADLTRKRSKELCLRKWMRRRTMLPSQL